LSVTLEHTRDWDKHLPTILFKYECGIQANTKCSPHMLLTGKTPRLRTNNFLSLLAEIFEDNAKLSILVVEMINKL
jgi:hypothetical protein